MKKHISLLIAAISFLSAALLPAADWPQWRGPQRDGISKETGLLKEWPKDGPKLLWQITDAGEGYSTPAVVGNALYALGNKGKDDEFIQARSVSNGKLIWTKRLGKVGPNTQLASYPGARSTPTVDGDVLYALGSDGDLACIKIADGTVVWQKSLRDDFAGKPGMWAYSESPLIDGDVLVCSPGGKEATMVALDKKTGKAIWKSAISEGDQAAYASAIIVEAGGVKQYVQFLQKGVVGVDAKSGKFLWRYDKTASGSPANIPTPVARGDTIYSSSGKGGGGLFKLKVDKGEFTADPIYSRGTLPTSIGGTVLLGDYLYGTSGKGLLCIEFTTGVEKWQNKCIGAASVCFADGRLYLHGENGEAALVEPTADGYHEKGRFTPADAPKHEEKFKTWAYPVVANGRLYLRDQGVLWSYDVKAPK